MARVLLAMSGGVDSSVAAWLLQQRGHEVVGVFMRHGQQQSGGWLPTNRFRGCCTAADAADARRVADMLGIPFHVVDFHDQFARIVDYFVDQYTSGRTPNPCIVCNTWLKFGKLTEYADRLGADYIATGHHARITLQDNGQFLLRCAVDKSKDQSYVLYGINRQLLPRLLFPVGEHDKRQIRLIAEQLGLQVASKRESQDICFIPDRDHAGFVRRMREGLDTSGEIVTADGVVVGRHNGIEQFTIGQRKGLRVALGQPMYVLRIESDSHRVVIGAHDELARSELFASESNWLKDCLPPSFRAQVKIRYRCKASDATVTLLPKGRFRVQFDGFLHGIAPGQAAVCYDDECVLGGGWIE